MSDVFDEYFTFNLCKDYILDIVDLLHAEFGLQKSIFVDKYLIGGFNYFSSVWYIINDQYKQYPESKFIIETFYDWASEIVSLYTIRNERNIYNKTLFMYLNFPFVDKFFYIDIGDILYQNIITKESCNVKEKMHRNFRINSSRN